MDVATLEGASETAANTRVFFDGIRINADSLTDPRWDRVLPIFEEAQIFMCRQMSTLLDGLAKGALVLDVGTGSGVFAIWAAKRGYRIVGVDINPRAILMAHKNAVDNDVKVYDSPDKLAEGGICLKLKRFDEVFAADKTFMSKFDYVLLNPPYNPTCPGVMPALHAESGRDGQRCFDEQIALVPQVLTPQGWCVGIQLTVSNEAEVEAFRKLKESFGEGCAIRYTHILDKKYYPTREFLQRQYESYLKGGKTSGPSGLTVENYIEEISKANSHFAFIYYEICKGIHDQPRGSLMELRRVFVPQRGWDDRIHLHRQIVDYIAPSARAR